MDVIDKAAQYLEADQYASCFAAAELAHKRLLDVVRNGDAEPEDMEAYEALDRALKDKP